MQDQNASSTSGFKAMSERADGAEASRSSAGQEGGKRASELQTLIEDEIRANPMRALCWAMVAGAVVGLWAAR